MPDTWFLDRIGRTRLRRTPVGAVIWHAIQISIQGRLMGLSAEAAFFSILSFPPLVFGLVGSVGYVAESIVPTTITDFRAATLRLAAQIFTADTVTEIIQPTVDEVLYGGRFDIISIGFIIALWSGSRVVNVFVQTVTIMYGLDSERGFVKQRVLSFGAYVIFVLLGIIIMPLVLIGPVILTAVLPDHVEWLANVYWPVVLVGAILGLTTIYWLILPVRRRWREALPGAVLAVIVWLGGSALLRLFLSYSAGSTSIYGPLATPIAVMLWLYVMSMAILIGAAINAGRRDAILEQDLQ